MRAVASLGEAEVRSIQRDVGFIEVTCEFCQESVRLEEQEVLNTIKKATAR
jgi:redox-regulated HSP33 family molecular chaperone